MQSVPFYRRGNKDTKATWLVQDRQDCKWQRQLGSGHSPRHPPNPHAHLLLAPPLRSTAWFPIGLPRMLRKVRHIWESAPRMRYCSQCREFSPWPASPFLVPERPLSPPVPPPSSSDRPLSGPGLWFTSLWPLPGLLTGHSVDREILLKFRAPWAPAWGEGPRVPLPELSVWHERPHPLASSPASPSLHLSASPPPPQGMASPSQIGLGALDLAVPSAQPGLLCAW